MGETRVTIGLPVYNAERYLRVALDAILKQTYRDFQLVISDNASTDCTEEICRQYAARDSRIRYSRNEKNLGMVPNFNRVFLLSNTEYFRWAAHDDLMEPELLEKCVDIMDKHPEVVLCYPRAKIIDGMGNLKEKHIPDPVTVGLKPEERFRNLILYPHLCTQIYGLIRSVDFKKTRLHGIYPSADEVLLAELGLMGEFYEIPEYLFSTRIHEASTTVGKYATMRSRTVLHDSSLRGKIFLPKWVYFLDCLRVIREAKIDDKQRLSCYQTMLRWVFVPPNFRALGKDVLIAMDQMVFPEKRPA